jgi:hypothetical protein
MYAAKATEVFFFFNYMNPHLFFSFCDFESSAIFFLVYDTLPKLSNKIETKELPMGVVLFSLPIAVFKLPS